MSISGVGAPSSRPQQPPTSSPGPSSPPQGPQGNPTAGAGDSQGPQGQQGQQGEAPAAGGDDPKAKAESATEGLKQFPTAQSIMKIALIPGYTEQAMQEKAQQQAEADQKEQEKQAEADKKSEKSQKSEEKSEKSEKA